MIPRIKFNIEPIAQMMVDRIPSEYINNPSSRFLDPAIGGGQVVKLLEDRVQCNIQTRVFGCEAEPLYVDYARNKNQLQGTYATVKYNDIIEKGFTMNFDVIVGNFPFTESPGDAREESGNSNNSTLYDDFLEVSFKTAKYINVIIPAGWAKKSAQVTRYLEKGLKSVTFLDAKKVFPDVAIRSGITVVEFEQGYNGDVTVTTTEGQTYQQPRKDPIQDVNPNIKTILSKIDSSGGLMGVIHHGDFEIPKGTKGSLDRLLASSKLYSETATSKYTTHVLLYSGGNSRSATWAYAKHNMPSTSGYKVTFPKASDRFILGKVRILKPGQGVSTALYYIKCDTKKEADKWQKWLEHNIVLYSLKHHKTNDTVNTYNNSMGHIPRCPDIDLTDSNLKKLFNFTDKEYELIQS
jgi:hypothetical protein